MNQLHLIPQSVPQPVHEAEALVLHCMDPRLTGPVKDYLDRRGLRGRYDQIALEGGAIGVMSNRNSAWADTFWQHVRLARIHHGIHKIIVIDHRDCTACQHFPGDTPTSERERETVVHMIWMEALADEIKTREPGLDVELLLMDLDETVEVIDG